MPSIAISVFVCLSVCIFGRVFGKHVSKFHEIVCTLISTQNAFDMVAVFGNKVERSFDIVAGVDRA